MCAPANETLSFDCKAPVISSSEKTIRRCEGSAHRWPSNDITKISIDKETSDLFQDLRNLSIFSSVIFSQLCVYGGPFTVRFRGPAWSARTLGLFGD